MTGPAESTRAPWPVQSLSQIETMLCAPGRPFEMETLSIRGLPTRTWRHAPPTLAHVIGSSRAFGDRVATIFESERISFGAQHRAVAALAGVLSGLGISRGDRIAIAMPNLPEWPITFFAIASLGAIAVPLNAWWSGLELAYALRDSGAKILIGDPVRLARAAPFRGDLSDLAMTVVVRSDGTAGADETLDALIGLSMDWAALPDSPLPDVPVQPDDDVAIFYTSGTTGQPKGAIGSHRNMASNIIAAAYVGARAALRRGDPVPEPARRVALLVVPLFHVTACNAGLMTATAFGNTNVFMRRWDAREAMSIIEREKVHSTGGVPTIVWQLLDHPERSAFDLSSLTTIGYGGAPSAPELVRRIRDELGAVPSNGWGMTETMATVTSHSAEDYEQRPSSCGPPLPVSDLKIMSMDGSTSLPAGTAGELWARGPQVVRGYWNKPNETAETFIDGWVRTGDLARLDEEGFCFIVDRSKDVIIRGGENIYSVEVENALYAHAAVMDAAVVGVSHRSWGEEVVAFVHFAPGSSASEEELQRWVGARLAKFKVPASVVVLKDPLPRNAAGKILKAELKRILGTDSAQVTLSDGDQDRR